MAEINSLTGIPDNYVVTGSGKPRFKRTNTTVISRSYLKKSSQMFICQTHWAERAHPTVTKVSEVNEYLD
jgi:hypothetical protein